MLISYIYMYLYVYYDYVIYIYVHDHIQNMFRDHIGIISGFAAYSIAGKSHKHTHIIQYIYHMLFILFLNPEYTFRFRHIQYTRTNLTACLMYNQKYTSGGYGYFVTFVTFLLF